jgi:DNA-binding transcriptional ArsR family regulator
VTLAGNARSLRDTTKQDISPALQAVPGLAVLFLALWPCRFASWPSQACREPEPAPSARFVLSFWGGSPRNSKQIIGSTTAYRAFRRAGHLGAHGSAARSTEWAPPVGIPAFRAGAPARVSQRPRGLAELDDFDAVFGALAHRSRRTILSVLHARGGEMTSGAIAARFDCSWPATSQHLRVLEQAGLVTVVMTGRERVYQLRADRLHAVAGSWLGRFR